MTTARTPPPPTPMLAAFATVAMLATAGCSLDVSLSGDTNTRTEHDTITVADLHALDVTTENGAIEIRGGGDDEISVRTVLRESNDGDATYSIDVDDGRVTLVGECDDGWWEHCSVAFVVTVPTDFDVDASSHSGRVEVSQIAGHVALETNNGAIAGNGLASPSVQARTDNGAIRLDFEDSPKSVITRSSNGAIAVRLPDLAGSYAVDAASNNGKVDVEVRVDRTSDRQVTARTDNGKIDIDYRSA